MRSEFELLEVCQIQNGYAFDSSKFSETQGMPLIRIRDLKANVCSLRFFGDFDKSYIVKAGDLLVGMDGEFRIYKWSGYDALLNQRVCRLVPKPEKLDSDFLLYRIDQDLKEIEDKTPSTTVKHLSSLTLGAVKLSLPGLDTQRQIAAKLKTQLAEVETARQALEIKQQEIVKLANAYIRQSIEHSKVSECPLGDVLDEVKKGIGECWADYPVLGATRDGLAPAKEPPGKQPQRYKPVFSGTVFYNPMRILIGSIAFVDDGDQPGITSPDYVALQGKPGIVDSRWFYYWLRSPYGVQCINSLARGAVRERMLFNRLAEGFIQLPPYSEQVRISAALKQLQPVKAAIKQQLDDLNKIPERLLATAFDFNPKRRSA
ncbi:restriction endonuclease subunit S [Methylomonas sp. TEB]|uniref:restriction endonuclease subunit S n=1 Tax=Methylomonas sp. TEB TaxID=3398229 RepID=UPI0039F4F55B